MALPGASSGVALAQISPPPTPTHTPTVSPTPTPTSTPIPIGSPAILTIDQLTVTVDEGQTAQNGGTAGDPDGSVVDIGASVGAATSNNDGTWSWEWPTSDGPADSRFVEISATDDDGNVTRATFELVVNNLVPEVAITSAPVAPVTVGELIQVSAVFTDPSLFDLHTGTIDWGDGTPCTTIVGAAPGCALDQDHGGGVVQGTHSYAQPGDYAVDVTVVDSDGGTASLGVQVEVLEPVNQPPVCSEARSSRAILWRPNHRFRPIRVLGLIDPDGDEVGIRIDSIFQDEAVDAPGSGHTSPDGWGVGTDRAWVRAERVGSGNGRVYHIGFTADDGRGGTCSDEVLVGVPEGRGRRGTPVDDGALYDSTVRVP
jgi:hypothetical protein